MVTIATIPLIEEHRGWLGNNFCVEQLVLFFKCSFVSNFCCPRPHPNFGRQKSKFVWTPTTLRINCRALVFLVNRLGVAGMLPRLCVRIHSAQFSDHRVCTTLQFWRQIMAHQTHSLSGRRTCRMSCYRGSLRLAVRFMLRQIYSSAAVWAHVRSRISFHGHPLFGPWTIHTYPTPLQRPIFVFCRSSNWKSKSGNFDLQVLFEAFDYTLVPMHLPATCSALRKVIDACTAATVKISPLLTPCLLLSCLLLSLHLFKPTAFQLKIHRHSMSEGARKATVYTGHKTLSFLDQFCGLMATRNTEKPTNFVPSINLTERKQFIDGVCRRVSLQSSDRLPSPWGWIRKANVHKISLSSIFLELCHFWADRMVDPSWLPSSVRKVLAKWKIHKKCMFSSHKLDVPSKPTILRWKWRPAGPRAMRKCSSVSCVESSLFTNKKENGHTVVQEKWFQVIKMLSHVWLNAAEASDKVIPRVVSSCSDVCTTTWVRVSTV